MSQDLIAEATETIDAPRDEVWDALVDPEAIQEYMFGTHVSSDWQEGSPITWEGEWEGTSYRDKGTILQVQPESLLQYSHFSPRSGQPDTPENYHTVTIFLAADGEQTLVTLTQDGNPTEAAQADATRNWEAMLAGLKEFLER